MISIKGLSADQSQKSFSLSNVKTLKIRQKDFQRLRKLVKGYY